jgi:chemotaxis regulatin CheY-phosphate phosphatase CheZ
MATAELARFTFTAHRQRVIEPARGESGFVVNARTVGFKRTMRSIGRPAGIWSRLTCSATTLKSDWMRFARRECA